MQACVCFPTQQLECDSVGSAASVAVALQSPSFPFRMRPSESSINRDLRQDTHPTPTPRETHVPTFLWHSASQLIGINKDGCHFLFGCDPRAARHGVSAAKLERSCISSIICHFYGTLSYIQLNWRRFWVQPGARHQGALTHLSTLASHPSLWSMGQRTSQH